MEVWCFLPVQAFPAHNFANVFSAQTNRLSAGIKNGRQIAARFAIRV
jgi:hypothetical protein